MRNRLNLLIKGIMADNRFDDIRPYYDSEIPAAMQRIAEYPMLTAVSEWLFREDRFLYYANRYGQLQVRRNCIRR
jgi:hypothetical protein